MVQVHFFGISVYEPLIPKKCTTSPREVSLIQLYLEPLSVEHNYYIENKYFWQQQNIGVIEIGIFQTYLVQIERGSTLTLF